MRTVSSVVLAGRLAAGCTAELAYVARTAPVDGDPGLARATASLREANEGRRTLTALLRYGDFELFRGADGMQAPVWDAIVIERDADVALPAGSEAESE